MEKTKIIRLKKLSRKTQEVLTEGQKEAARLWNFCVSTHKKARNDKSRWPEKDDLQKATKGGVYALYSQTIQMIVAQFLANIDTTRQVRQKNKNIRYPHKEKHFYPLSWPKQAVKIRNNRILLSMGKGRKSLLLKTNTEGMKPGACTIVWRDGFELHMTCESSELPRCESEIKATIDLGEIHLAAVTTSHGEAMVVSGRGIRSQKRLINKSIRRASKKFQKCRKGSRRSKKIHKAKRKLIDRSKKRIRDLRHKATTKVIGFCKKNQVSEIFVGNPDGVRRKSCGRKLNQKLAGWEYGKDLDYIKYKSKQAGIASSSGSERGTSSHCPECRWKQKPIGRNWKCKNKGCGFESHRDIVGALNMFPLHFDMKIAAPKNKDITYLRIPYGKSSSSLGTGQSCLSDHVEISHLTPGSHVSGGSSSDVSLEAHPL